MAGKKKTTSKGGEDNVVHIRGKRPKNGVTLPDDPTLVVARDEVVSTSAALVSAEQRLKDQRKRYNGEVESSDVGLREAIEQDVDEPTLDQLVAWRDAVIGAHKKLVSAENARDKVVPPLSKEVKSLRKTLREQIANIDQLKLGGVAQ